jgi:hypothetical protein
MVWPIILLSIFFVDHALSITLCRSRFVDHGEDAGPSKRIHLTSAGRSWSKGNRKIKGSREIYSASRKISPLHRAALLRFPERVE